MLFFLSLKDHGITERCCGYYNFFFFFLFRKQLIFFSFLSQRAQKIDFPSLNLFFVINVIDNASVVSAVLGSTV